MSRFSQGFRKPARTHTTTPVTGMESPTSQKPLGKTVPNDGGDDSNTFEKMSIGPDSGETSDAPNLLPRGHRVGFAPANTEVNAANAVSNNIELPNAAYHPLSLVPSSDSTPEAHPPGIPLVCFFF